MQGKAYYVYRHMTPDGKVYIGITSQNPKHRFDKGRGYFYNERFRGAILHYGWENISHEILTGGLSREAAISEEKRLIDHYGSTDPRKGYNLMTGGDTLGTHIDETREKLRLISTGKTRTLASIEKQRQKLLGHTLSESAREALRLKRLGDKNPFYGRKHKEETKQLIREHSVSKPGGKSNLAKRVQKLDMSGNLLCEYDAITTAAKENGIASPYNITGCISGRQKTCGGYMWRFADTR